MLVDWALHVHFLSTVCKVWKLHFNSNKYHCHERRLLCHSDNCDHINLSPFPSFGVGHCDVSTFHVNIVSLGLWSGPPITSAWRLKAPGAFLKMPQIALGRRDMLWKGEKNGRLFYATTLERRTWSCRSRQPTSAWLRRGSRLEPVMQAEDVRGERNWGRGTGGGCSNQRSSQTLRQVNEGLGRDLAAPRRPWEPDSCTQSDGPTAKACSIPRELNNEVARGKHIYLFFSILIPNGPLC